MITAVPPSAKPVIGAIPEIVGAGSAETLRENPAAEEEELASLTLAVKEKLPADAVAPVMLPV
jgi:hypothetical protein